MKLSGKVAIVTGSGRGLGKAMALKFASEGAAVVVCARTIEKVHQVVDEIKNQGGTALAVRTDVTNKADVHNLVKSTLEKFKAGCVETEFYYYGGALRPVSGSDVYPRAPGGAGPPRVQLHVHTAHPVGLGPLLGDCHDSHSGI